VTGTDVDAHLRADLDTVLVASSGVAATPDDGDRVTLVRLADCGLWTLAGSAAAVWGALDGRRTLGDVAAELSARHPRAAASTVREDVLACAADLVALELASSAVSPGADRRAEAAGGVPCP